MKVNFDVVFKTIEGEEIKVKENEDRAFTLKDASISALMVQFDDEKNLSGEEKVNRYAIACKVRSGGECDLKVEEIALLKKLIGKAYGSLIVGQAWQMLEA